MKGRILFADNNEKYLKVRTEFLVDANYEVIQAGTIEEAEQVLREGWVHLAIIDVRMIDDNDEADVSGLNLARQPDYRHIPKIILTGFPTFENVRDVMGPEEAGLPSAVDFIAKKEGPDTLIQAIERAFNKYVRINQALIFTPHDQSAFKFLHLISLIDPELKEKSLLDYANELEDLFRRLFYRSKLVELERLLWDRNGRVALIAHAFDEAEARESFLINCGRRQPILEDLQTYKRYAPLAPGDNATILLRSYEATHLAVNAFGLAASDFAHLYTLKECFQTSPQKSFQAALDTLFHKTLLEWQLGKHVIADQTHQSWYVEQLRLSERDLQQSGFEDKFRTISKQAAKLRANIRLIDDRLEVQYEHQGYSYPDPLRLFYHVITLDRPLVLTNSPGLLSGRNILTDPAGHAWLTDFADAGSFPVEWNCLSLETAIRFDWVETNNLQRLHEMEICLAQGRFSRPDLSTVEPVVKKTLKGIQAIRLLAIELTGVDELAYLLGIFYQAAGLIARADLDYPSTDNELARLAHAVLVMGVVGQRISDGLWGSPRTVSGDGGLSIDETNYIVRVRGQEISVQGQGYKLLYYLYEHRNQVCKRADIAQHVFGVQNYAALSVDALQLEVSRMNAAIRRLREKIEADPDHPRHLITHEGVGYRLVVTE